MTEIVSAGVHRFRDRVAVHVGGGETVYLDIRVARQMARALWRASRDIDQRSFVDSTFEPWSAFDVR